MTIRSLLISLGLYRLVLNYKYQPDEHHVETLNFWGTLESPKKLFHYQFATHHFSHLLSAENSLMLGSVFGPRKLLALSKSRNKIFYTGENVARFKEYRDHCKGIADLAIGFDYINRRDYQRFPIWIEYFIPPWTNAEGIRNIIKDFVIKDICPNESKRFASLVCSHDKGNTRTKLFHLLSQIDRVDSGGAYLNNTDALKKEFNDDKGKFIGHYKFNICPENTDREGYVTEKVFEAIRYNTIPVYWGGLNNPEPDVLNKDAILFYKGPDSAPGLLKQIEELHNHPKLYKEFLEQPKFQPKAAEYIIDLYEDLYTKMQQMLSRQNVTSVSLNRSASEAIR